PDGKHSLVLQATDAGGNTTTRTVGFDLLTHIGAPTLALAPADQASTATATDSSEITLVGQADQGDRVSLVSTGATTIANNEGAFQFVNVPLTVGDNPLQVQASDLANNTSDFSLTVQRSAPSGLTNPVLQWNQLALNAIALDADAPTVASRALAMESLAVYD